MADSLPESRPQRYSNARIYMGVTFDTKNVQRRLSFIVHERRIILGSLGGLIEASVGSRSFRMHSDVPSALIL